MICCPYMTPSGYISVPASAADRLEHLAQGLLDLAQGMKAAAQVVKQPKAKPIPKDQAWFWTKRWQQWEREADADITAGRVKGFDNVEELLADLNT